MSDLVRSVEYEHVLSRPREVPIQDLRPGDTVRVHFRIVEGKRERLQPFQGIVIRMRSGLADANLTVRRVGAHGIGVERTFPLHSPRLDKIELLRHAHVRRANLYYLRQRTGKRARLRELRRRPSELEAPAEQETPASGE